MNLKTLKIKLGQKGPNSILPDDVIQGTRTNIKCHVKRVAFDKVEGMYWVEVELENPMELIDTEYMLVRASKVFPWYHEVCKTCSTPESCDICQEMTGWTTKKFAYIGDTIEFFGSTEVIEEISTDIIMDDELIVTTDRSKDLMLNDPEVKIVKRGPWLCYREKINPNYLAHCSVCMRPRCLECFFKKLQENQR